MNLKPAIRGRWPCSAVPSLTMYPGKGSLSLGVRQAVPTLREFQINFGNGRLKKGWYNRTPEQIGTASGGRGRE